MAETYFCVTVDDVGLENYSSIEHLEKLLSFWDKYSLKGTLFVVPRCNNTELGEMKDYVRLLKQAAENGHEIAQHGLDHRHFQTGIPPKMVLELSHEYPARKYLAEHRAKIEAALSVENLRETLSIGRTILESAIGKHIRGFRAPCLSICVVMSIQKRAS